MFVLFYKFLTYLIWLQNGPWTFVCRYLYINNIYLKYYQNINIAPEVDPYASICDKYRQKK
jgi:hypothetical protein